MCMYVYTHRYASIQIYVDMYKCIHVYMCRPAYVYMCICTSNQEFRIRL